MFHWLVVHLSQETGTSNEASRAYAYWSGFGSIFPWELAIVGGLAGFYRHHNCHVTRCPWPGRTVPGTHYLACPKHHPAHKGNKRGVSVETIHDAHREAQ